jgi:hypothetical protein
MVSPEWVLHAWNTFLDRGQRRFTRLSYEKGLIAKSLRIKDIIDPTDGAIAKMWSRQLVDIREICKRMKMANSMDFKKIDKETIDRNMTWLKQNSERLHSNFNLRLRSSGKFDTRAAYDLTQKVFHAWGYTKIRGSRKWIANGAGKRTRDYWWGSSCSDERLLDIWPHIREKDVKERNHTPITVTEANPGQSTTELL